MGLSAYNQKRHFNKTKEPEGKQKSSKGALKFVIQKHDASHLHYDFRLEMEGVLKSWAVPKGPSLNPADKRLAMAVEDHPFDYRNFEGIIPAGEYGGGTVIVWDEGTYEPMNADGLSRKEQEKLLLKQLHSGDLKLNLQGQKIKGTYALFKMKARGENTWLLVKKNDEFATDEVITEQNKSVKTGKTLVEVAHDHGTEVNHPEEETTKKKLKKPVQLLSKKPAKTTATKKATSKKKVVDTTLINELKKAGIKSPMPEKLVPMLASLVDEPFDNEDWIFEIKWDGYRAVAFCNGKKSEIFSRNLLSFTSRYFPVADALNELNIHAVFDGEIVAINEKGYPDFQLMQNWQNSPSQLQYAVFDIIWLEGYDLTEVPLVDRKKILKNVLPADHAVIKFSDHILEKGIDFFKVAMEQGLEGIMGKRADSLYHIGARTDEWVKIKVNQRQEVVIGGFTKPRNSRKHFGSLLLGVYEEGELIYVGHTGSGFNTQSLDEMSAKLQPLVTEKCPFSKEPKTNMPATWVKPKLVCEIKFSEWTQQNVARHPIFMGLRSDKKATDVRLEKSTNMKGTKVETEKSAAKKQKTQTRKVAEKTAVASPKSTKTVSEKKRSKKNSTENLQLDFSKEKDQKITLNGNELSLTNLNKPYWKKEKFTKGDMINYYLKIAPYMMPYMRDRPQSLNRHPNGISGPSFYQKDVRGKVPDWIKTHKNFSESNNETIEYLVCNDEATLIYMANLGCIEMHPWHSRTKSDNKPDWCLIDLDPDDNNTFDQVIEVAHVVKEILDSIGAESYPKTSGSSGLHIMVPLGAKYSYDQSRQLAELVVNLVHQQLPSFTSIERNPKKRKGQIYLDYLQNRQIQTAASAYSLRPKPGVPVSTPLDWSEIKKGLTPTTYTAFNIFDKLKTDGDPFKPVLGKGINLEKVIKKLGTLFN